MLSVDKKWAVGGSPQTFSCISWLKNLHPATAPCHPHPLLRFSFLDPFFGGGLVFGGFLRIAKFFQKTLEETKKTFCTMYRFVHALFKDGKTIHRFTIRQFQAFKDEVIGIERERPFFLLLRARIALRDAVLPTSNAALASTLIVGVPLRILLSKAPPPSATRTSGHPPETEIAQLARRQNPIRLLLVKPKPGEKVFTERAAIAAVRQLR